MDEIPEEDACASGGATSPTNEACEDDVDVAEAERTTLGVGACGGMPTAAGCVAACGGTIDGCGGNIAVMGCLQKGITKGL